MRLLALAAALGAAGLATAGTADDPEIADDAGDCAVPYGNPYLDVSAAWIEGEDAARFVVVLELAAWDALLAEAAGYSVQFTAAGVETGVVATYITPEGGWAFYTGHATADVAEDFVDTEGGFDAGSRRLTIEFPKTRLPRSEANATTLTGIHALTADLRPTAVFAATDQDANGTWILCDEALASRDYALGAPSASGAPVLPAAATGETPGDPAAPDEARATPVPALVGVAALALAGLRRRSR